MTELTPFEHDLLLAAVSFYLCNKQAEPISGQVPLIGEMRDLYGTLVDPTVYLYKKAHD